MVVICSGGWLADGSRPHSCFVLAALAACDPATLDFSRLKNHRPSFTVNIIHPRTRTSGPNAPGPSKEGQLDVRISFKELTSSDPAQHHDVRDHCFPVVRVTFIAFNVVRIMC